MANYKLNIADPKEGKCYKTEVKDTQATSLVGLNIGEKIEGAKLGIEGYEFEVTGGMDYAGFPMRHGILGERKRITMYPGTGFRKGLKGMKKRKTVCGHKINDKISAVNLKVLKAGAKKLSDLFGSKEQADQKAEERPKEVKTEEKKEAKPEEKPKKEEKPEQKTEEKPKEAAKEKK